MASLMSAGWPGSVFHAPELFRSPRSCSANNPPTNEDFAFAVAGGGSSAMEATREMVEQFILATAPSRRGVDGVLRIEPPMPAYGHSSR
jgi:hypothetical protein